MVSLALASAPRIITVLRMPLFSIILIALGLAMDACAVSISSGISIKPFKIRHAFLIGTTFGIFQALMPALGWFAGQWAYRFISAVDYWIAFGLLLFVGGHMIIQSLQSDDKAHGPRNPLHLPTLLTLAVATSIDALAIGISLSMLQIKILAPALIIGIITFVLSFAGVYFGRTFRRFSEKKIEVIGGLVLIGLGAKMLIEHLVQHQEIFSGSDSVWFAFGLTLLAGLATGIGSLLALFSRHTRERRFSFIIGFASGLLIWIAFVQFQPALTGQQPAPVSIIAFFAAFILCAFIDKLVPDFGNPHTPHRIEEIAQDPDFRRTGMPAAAAMIIHSFPEGFALFVIALHAPVPVAIGVAAAIALHNIPEGISTALPMYHATGSRVKACGFSSLTGLSEPLGALIVYTLFYNFFSGGTAVILNASAAGILIFVAFDGLLPVARVYGRYHHATYGVLAGMFAGAMLMTIS